MRYSIRVFNPDNIFAPDQFRDTPEEALTLARDLSRSFPAVVCSDARNWVQFEKGAIVSVRTWVHFYLGEPSEEYVALRDALKVFAPDAPQL